LGVTAGTLFVTLFQLRAWVSGWFPATVAIVVITWVGAPRIAYFSSLLGGGLVATRAQSLINSLLYVGDNEYSQMTRIEAWRIVAQIVQVNPILGLGPSNYSWYTPLFPILGYYVQFNSHNNYVDIIAQTGVLGLLCFLWFAWEVGKLGLRLRALTPEGTFERAYVYGALGGLVATTVAGMLGDWVLPYVYNITINGLRASVMAWLFLGGLVAIEQILLNGRRVEDTVEEA
jgi:O-antigen ligase